MMLEVLLIIIGLVLLWKGSDLTVDASKKLALKFGISHALIGLTLVSIGTSLPEITTNIYSGLRIRAGADVSGIAVGLIIGSQISQITFILGSAALFGIMYRTRQTYRREAPMLFIAIFGLFLAGLDGHVYPVEALILIIVYLAYLYLLYRDYRTESLSNKERKKYSKISTGKELALAVIGLAVLIVGGKLVVDSAEVLAEELRVTDTLIGILVVGPGAALPELSVAITGMRKRASGISLGTLLGSNITDPLFSFSVGAIFAGYTFDTALLWFDIPYWTMATAIALGMMWKGKRIGSRKTSGMVLICIFVIYVLLKLSLFH
jgi:cation:H+ antiporter